MKTRTANWFECKISYEKTIEDGTQKKVKETYTVDALSFTEAESEIIEEMSAYISGAFTVENINKASYSEIFFDDRDSADKWYKAKLQFITIDEKTAKEKRSNVYYLVQGSSLKRRTAKRRGSDGQHNDRLRHREHRRHSHHGRLRDIKTKIKNRKTQRLERE